MINNLNLEDIILKSPHSKLDYILSVILPSNPVELIALEKTEKLLIRLKEEYANRARYDSTGPGH